MRCGAVNVDGQAAPREAAHAHPAALARHYACTQTLVSMRLFERFHSAGMHARCAHPLYALQEHEHNQNIA